jgi:hypothetical protein
MKDFGFYVRMVAILALFGIVLANFGGQWLSPDNPIVASEKPEALKPLRQVAAEARPRKASVTSISHDDRSARKLGAAGWGGDEPDRREKDEDADSSFDEAGTPGAADEESDWGSSGTP